MFINYKKRYKRILEIIENERSKNYKCYRELNEMIGYDKKRNSEDFASLDKFICRTEALNDLINKINMEFGD